MLYEYRCYQAVPRRLPDLHRRLQELSLPLFAKHEIEAIGFWVTEVGTSDQLHFLLRWQDLAHRKVKLDAFGADPEWQRGRSASEANGPLVARATNQLWTPTAYSPLK